MYLLRLLVICYLNLVHLTLRIKIVLDNICVNIAFVSMMSVDFSNWRVLHIRFCTLQTSITCSSVLFLLTYCLKYTGCNHVYCLVLRDEVRAECAPPDALVVNFSYFH
jgi:hypothetical protein